MNLTYEKVRDVLTSYPETKDNDRLLCCYFWWAEMGGPDTDNGFLSAYREGKLTTADSITRARRKLQEEDKTLRGKKWYERHNRAEEYKQDIINFNYE